MQLGHCAMDLKDTAAYHLCIVKCFRTILNILYQRRGTKNLCQRFNSRSNSGHPCLVPLCIEKVMEVQPLTPIHAWGWVYRIFIQEIKRVSRATSVLWVLEAVDSCKFVNSLSRLMIVDIPGIKTAWSDGMRDVPIEFNRAAMIFDRILRSVLIKDIRRNDSLY